MVGFGQKKSLEQIDSLLAAGQTTSALDVCERILTADPENTAVLIRKGHCLGNLGRFREAAGIYDTVLEDCPENDNAWCNKALALMKMGDTPGALNAVDRALQVNPRYAKAWNTKALLLSDLGRLEDALRCWQESVAVEPVELSQLGLVVTLLDLGRPCQALSALGSGPWDLPEAFRLRGKAFHGLGRFEKAIRCLKYAAKLDENSSET
jgi:tetratricopeptide (TPR) repeat protein